MRYRRRYQCRHGGWNKGQSREESRESEDEDEISGRGDLTFTHIYSSNETTFSTKIIFACASIETLLNRVSLLLSPSIAKSKTHILYNPNPDSQPSTSS
jgi:hypothetical protein